MASKFVDDKRKGKKVSKASAKDTRKADSTMNRGVMGRISSKTSLKALSNLIRKGESQRVINIAADLAGAASRREKAAARRKGAVKAATVAKDRRKTSKRGR